MQLKAPHRLFAIDGLASNPKPRTSNEGKATSLAWSTLKGEQTSSNFSGQVVGFQPLSHNKQTCKTCPINNRVKAISLVLHTVDGRNKMHRPRNPGLTTPLHIPSKPWLLVSNWCKTSSSHTCGSGFGSFLKSANMRYQGTLWAPKGL